MSGTHGKTLRSLKDSPIDPPAGDELEVSIFGPGKGEAIAIHVGGGRWVLVDSCTDQGNKNIPALTYLERIGVDVSKQVDLLVATHAHDDHFAGISEVLARSEEAVFVIAPAATSEEFLALAHAELTDSFDVRQSAYDEYRKSFAIIRQRNSDGRGKSGAQLRWAFPDRRLSSWNFQTHESSVISLSPSDLATLRARSILADNAIRAGEGRKFKAIDPNEFSIALKVEAGLVSVLLGADLTIGPSGCGWLAVLEDHTDEALKSSLFKVAHHGSENAHLDAVWDRMLEDSPIALLAPYRAGRKPLPSQRDRDRILSLTDTAYCTASPTAIARSKAVRRTKSELGSIASDVRDPWGRAGHVRARTKVTAVADWRVELFPPAVDLKTVR